jgi:hypothetical protein
MQTTERYSDLVYDKVFMRYFHARLYAAIRVNCLQCLFQSIYAESPSFSIGSRPAVADYSLFFSDQVRSRSIVSLRAPSKISDKDWQLRSSAALAPGEFEELRTG